MSMAKIRFSHKTVGIAIASAVAMGGIAIPQAGAVGGRTGEFLWYLDTEGNLISNTNPNSAFLDSNELIARYPTWGVSQTGGVPEGGYFENVPVVDSPAVNGFSAVNRGGGGASAATAGSLTFPRGYEKEVLQVKNMPTADWGVSTPTKTSMDAKKMYYTAFSIVNDIVKNEGLSPTLKSRLKSYGYAGDFGKTAVEGDVAQSEYHWTGEGKISDDQIRMGKLWQEGSNNSDGHTTFYSGGDYVTSVVASIVGAVDAFDHGNLSPDTPFSFQDVYAEKGDADYAAFNEIVGVDSMNKSDTDSLMFAVTQMARDVSDRAIEESDLVVHRAGGPGEPLLFSLSESSPAPAEDLPQGPEAPAEDLHVTDVKEDGEGNYTITRSDGEFWTINLKDIRDAIKALEDKKSPTKDEFDKVKTDLDKVKKDVEDLQAKDEALQNEINKLKKDVEGLDKRVTDLEGRVTELEKSVIKEVVKNSDGTYTLIRENGDKVPGNIDPRSGSVTDVKTDGKGNLVITINGKDKTVPLKQVKVTEENKGTPDHTVTITTPDGKSVTFNVFDTYVTDIKWNEAEGVYEIYRSDVDGGKTVWKTIDLSDLRNRIDALEKKDSPSRDEYNTLVTEVRENRELIEKLKEQIKGQNAADQEKITSILEKITEIEKQLTDMQADLDDIKARLTKVEGRTDDITKCVAGAGMAGIPALLSIPLMVMTQLNIPGIKDLNTQIQKQIGIYNPELARAWERNGGVLQAGAVLAGLAGMIGGIAYLAKQCDPMMQSDAAKETDLGKLSSKLEKGSSKKDAGTTQPGEQDAPAADAPADTDAEAPTEGAVEDTAEAAEPATEPSEDLVAAQ